MNFGLTHEQDLIVTTVRGFVERELYPLEAEVERTGELPMEIAREIQRKVLALGTRPHQHGAQPLVGPPVQHPLRLQRRAARALPAALGARRADRRAGDDRARCRLRRARHEVRGAARRRRLDRQRHQALHQPCRRGRLRDRLHRHRRGIVRPQAHHLLPGRPRHARLRNPARLRQREPSASRSASSKASAFSLPTASPRSTPPTS